MFLNILKKGAIISAIALSIFSEQRMANAQVLEPSNLNPEVEQLTKEEKRAEAIEQLLKDFPYETSRLTSICKRAFGGNIGPLGGKLRNEVVIQEYFRSNRVLPDAFSVTTPPEEVRGVGARVIVVIHSLDAKLDLSFLSSLIGIGIAADENKVTGTVSVTTYGIGGKSLTGIMPVTTEISVNSMTDALTSIKSIKSQLVNTDQFITSLTWDGFQWMEDLPTIDFPVFTSEQLNNLCKPFKRN